MTNRKKFISSKSEYQLMMNIEENVHICPLQAVAGITTGEKYMRCAKHISGGCKECVQLWLDEEE